MPDASPKPFELHEFVPFLLNRVGALMELSFTPDLKRAGLTLDMWRVLMVLHFNGPMTLVDLSRTTGVKTPTLSRLVGRMEERDLVSRRRSTEDTRTVDLRLKPAGETMFRELWPVAADLQEAVIGSFSADQISQLRAMLKQAETALINQIAGTEAGAMAAAANGRNSSRKGGPS